MKDRHAVSGPGGSLLEVLLSPVVLSKQLAGILTEPFSVNQISSGLKVSPAGRLVRGDNQLA